MVEHRLAITNPLDVPSLDETEAFASLVVTASASAGADVVLAVELSLVHDRVVLTAMLRQRPPDSAPIVLTHLSEDDVIPADLVALLAEVGVAVVPTPERAAKVVGRLADAAGGAPPVPRHGSEYGGTRRGQLLGLDAIAGLLPTDFPWGDLDRLRGSRRRQAHRCARPPGSAGRG